MKLEELDAQMNATIIFTVFYGDMPEEIVGKMMDGIVFLFNRDDAIKLEEGLEVKRKRNKKEKYSKIT